MEKKIAKLIGMMTVLVIAVNLAGCSSEDEPKLPEADEVKKALEGSWVSFDNGTWERIEFSRSSVGNGEYTLLDCDDINRDSNVKASVGEWRYPKGYHTPTIVLNDTFHTPGLSTSRLFLNEVKDLEVRWKPSANSSDTEKDCKSRKVTFHRVVASYFGEPGEEFTFVAPSYLANQSYMVENSLDPSIATFDEVGSRVKVTGYGTTYIPVKVKDMTAYIEVTGSPIVEMPYPFEGIIGVWGKIDELDIYWGDRLDPLYQEYKGIFSIAYEDERLTQTFVVLKKIRICLDSSVNAYAKWLIACKIGTPIRYDKGLIFRILQAQNIELKLENNSRIFTYS